MAIGPGASPPAAAGPAPAGATGSASPDVQIAWCLVAATAPALEGSPYGPLITFAGAVGFCTASPVTIVDQLVLWQYRGGGYQEDGSSQGGGVDSDTDGSVVGCYSPWNVYYAFHTEMLVALYYGGGVGYGYANSPDAQLNCDH